MRRTITALLVFTVLVSGEIRRHPKGEVILHEKYIRVVSEQVSPVQKEYVATKDGLYVAAAIRKPQGSGPFPALIYFHGAPGGRGMEKLVTWSLGETAGRCGSASCRKATSSSWRTTGASRASAFSRR